MRGSPPPRTVLDLGCGVGGSLREFRTYNAATRWVGLDISDSMEAEARPSLDAPVVMFDGVRIPFADASVDFIYSHQVFEHVRYPHLLLDEIARVLMPRGWFAGSTSQLEPYHSRSFWNYTVPGFCTLVNDAGMDIVELRPGIDGLTLTERAFNGNPPDSSRWFSKESPLNQKVDKWASRTGRGVSAVNNRKLRFCGHFAFLARR